MVATILGGILTTILMKGPDMLANSQRLPGLFAQTKEKFFSWYHDDKEWSGVWTSYPEGIGNLEDMHLSKVDLRIEVEARQGDIGGMIGTGALCEAVPLMNFAMLEGSVSGSTAKVVAWDTVGGRRINYAALRIDRDGDVITVTPIEGVVRLFPATARLGRHPVLDRKQEDAKWDVYCKAERVSALKRMLPAATQSASSAAPQGSGPANAAIRTPAK